MRYLLQFLVGMIGAAIGVVLICWIILGNSFTIYGQGLDNK